MFVFGFIILEYWIGPTVTESDGFQAAKKQT